MQRILGQEQAIDVLRRALRSGRMHHAWIFSGPAGVGKFTTACAVAQLLLDPDAAANLAGDLESDPDGRTARLIASGAHPDLHVIRKELAAFSENRQLRTRKLANIPLDVLREHVIGGKTSDDKIHDAPAYRTAVLGHGKAFIIDESELIDVNGQNTLLKTLEEPPPQTYLFLITARPERLLPTVHSRCQHVRFTPLDDTPLRQWFDASGLELEPDDRRWLEVFCEGAPGVAVRAAEFGFRDWQQTLAPMLADLERGRFPSRMGETLGGLVDGYADAWVKANANASKAAANLDGARAMFALLAAHVRQRMAEAAETGEPRLLAAQLAATECLRDAERQLAVNVNLKQVFENLVVQWRSAAAAPATTLLTGC